MHRPFVFGDQGVELFRFKKHNHARNVFILLNFHGHFRTLFEPRNFTHFLRRVYEDRDLEVTSTEDIAVAEQMRANGAELGRRREAASQDRKRLRAVTWHKADAQMHRPFSLGDQGVELFRL